MGYPIAVNQYGLDRPPRDEIAVIRAVDDMGEKEIGRTVLHFRSDYEFVVDLRLAGIAYGRLGHGEYEAVSKETDIEAEFFKYLPARLFHVIEVHGVIDMAEGIEFITTDRQPHFMCHVSYPLSRPAALATGVFIITGPFEPCQQGCGGGFFLLQNYRHT